MFKYLPRYIAVKILRIYQKTISFDHGLLKPFAPHGRCRFRPTCSEYAISALEKYGLIKGGLRAIWRVLRCNPWNNGGWDPLQ